MTTDQTRCFSHAGNCSWADGGSWYRSGISDLFAQAGERNGTADTSSGVLGRECQSCRIWFGWVGWRAVDIALRTIGECVIATNQVCDISVRRGVVAGGDGPKSAAGKQKIGREFVLRLVRR